LQTAKQNGWLGMFPLGDYLQQHKICWWNHRYRKNNRNDI